jgi:hypothetical protein
MPTPLPPPLDRPPPPPPVNLLPQLSNVLGGTSLSALAEEEEGGAAWTRVEPDDTLRELEGSKQRQQNP